MQNVTDDTLGFALELYSRYLFSCQVKNFHYLKHRHMYFCRTKFSKLYITNDFVTVAIQTFLLLFIHFSIFIHVFFISFLFFHGFPWYFKRRLLNNYKPVTAWKVSKYVFSGLYWFQMQENTDQKKLRIWTLFVQCVIRPLSSLDWISKIVANATM